MDRTGILRGLEASFGREHKPGEATQESHQIAAKALVVLAARLRYSPWAGPALAVLLRNRALWALLQRSPREARTMLAHIEWAAAR
jgi:hypothetical protein